LDFMGYQKTRLDYEVLRRTIEEMAKLGVKSIMFAGEGEPVLYKQLPEIIEQCTQVDIDTALTTNMVPFTRKNTEVFVRNCKWIKVSINAGTAETYEMIHRCRNGDFERVVENMHRASQVKKAVASGCTLGAQMLLLPENADTAVSLAKTVREAGFDYLVIKPYSQHPSSITTKYKEIDYWKYLSLADELKKFESERFKIIFRFDTIKKLLNLQRTYTQCHAVPFFWAYITASGDVFGCSAYLASPDFGYGNIAAEGFREIWEGTRRQQNLAKINRDLHIGQCRVNCRMDEINRYLHELVVPGEHVNFI
jgi:GTP 3',8-cyclase